MRAAVTMGLLQLYPAGGNALSLTPPRLIVALVANFVLGALVTLGIGSYGPSLVLFSLLGMEPRAAFPIMMGSEAFMRRAPTRLPSMTSCSNDVHRSVPVNHGV